MLCADCGAIARRAKSEVVLATMLRNRRREADTRYQNAPARISTAGCPARAA